MRSIPLAIIAATVIAPDANAAQIDLAAYVDANVSNYSGGYAYPTSGTTTIGGIDFALASYAGGTGVVQLDGAESHDIAIGEDGIDTVYVIVNSAYGSFGATVGTLTFNGTGANSYGVSLVEGTNIRDHYNAFNTIATDVWANATYSSGARFDVYRYVLPASFASDTLTSLTFSSINAGNPQGAPFLAGVTTATEAVAAVPEASTWAMMVGGFGLIGGALKRRQRTMVAFAAKA